VKCAHTRRIGDLLQRHRSGAIFAHALPCPPEAAGCDRMASSTCLWRPIGMRGEQVLGQVLREHIGTQPAVRTGLADFLQQQMGMRSRARSRIRNRGTISADLASPSAPSVTASANKLGKRWAHRNGTGSSTACSATLRRTGAAGR
jgi:hypothetical protein